MTSINGMHEIREPVLKWLESMRIDGSNVRYKFSETSGDSLFTSCFALFILDLFRETDNLSEKHRQEWAEYIQSFQHEEDGLFYPDPIYHPDKERAIFQATCFCLSALCILGETPKHRLSVVDRWRTKENLEEYLIGRGCHLGHSGSGNKAMFQAILLTHAYEITGDEDLRDAIEIWFEFHDRHQNEYGFWGQGERGRLYAGMQNAFHQYMIYEYWGRNYPNIEKVMDTVLKLQDDDGYFAPVPGGGACKDYDALHLLLNSGYVKLSDNIIQILEKAERAIKRCWNEDGGFCENRLRPIGVKQLPKIISFILHGENLQVKKLRAHNVAVEVFKRRAMKSRRWVPENQSWNESTLWDTWFRSLSLAEVSNTLHGTSDSMFRFHNHIGIGFNKLYSNIHSY